jgi:hypothetical protein
MPSPPDRSFLRQLYDGAERRIAPPLEQFVRTGQYADITSAIGQVQSVVTGAVQGATERFWHLVNLPAGSDVQKLRRQVGALDREVRRLQLQLAQQTEKVHEDADGADANGSAGPGPSRGGTQHPESP